MFAYLESYLMRRMITRGTTKNYNNIFRSLIGNQVSTEDDLKKFIYEREDASVRMPSDDKIISAFNTEALSNKQAKGVLFLIESAVRDSRQSTRLLDFDDYSLEHVMPKKWRNNWDSTGLNEQQKRDRDDLVLTLGNLTLITSSLNSAIRDSDWNRKREGSGGSYGLNMLAQGIETFSPYLKEDEWNEEVITKRAKLLFKHALQVWSVPEEFQTIKSRENEYKVDLNTLFYCKGASGNAQGKFNIEMRMVVEKGSLAAGIIQPSFVAHTYNKERERLIEQGVLAQKDDHYIFTNDCNFSSPSAAAAVVLGRSADGPSEWKTEEGKALNSFRA